MKEKNIMKCAVIGANGYIGRHLCQNLESNNYKVYAYGKSKINNYITSDTTTYKSLDISNKGELSVINSDIDYVFVLSGITGTNAGFDNHEEFLSINELGLLNILDYYRDKKDKPRIVFPSTRLIYKGSDQPLKENDQKYPKSIYAINKLSCEKFLHAYSNYYSISFTIFRICVPFGNVFNNNFSYGTIGFMLNNATQNTPITLFGDGETKRTFTHINSICKQIILSVQNDHSVNQVYNISGETLSLKEAAKIIGDKFNVDIKYDEWPRKYLLLETGNTVFDSTKIESLIKISPMITFKDWVHKL